MWQRRCFSISAMLAVFVIFATQSGAARKTELAASVGRGRALFFGNAPLQGKPRDHSDFLPPAVVRCSNCHASGKLKLDAATLIEPLERRGGPPSAYTEADFCRLLTSGIDPASVMVDHAMPVYRMPHRDCASLWAYVTRSEGTRHVR